MKFDIIVVVDLLPTLCGGRKGATPEKQFGCLFELRGKYFDCRLDLSKTGPLLPGESATVPIAFLSPDSIVPCLTAETEFQLWDGRTIANGKVISINSERGRTSNLDKLEK